MRRATLARADGTRRVIVPGRRAGVWLDGQRMDPRALPHAALPQAQRLEERAARQGAPSPRLRHDKGRRLRSEPGQGALHGFEQPCRVRGIDAQRRVDLDDVVLATTPADDDPLLEQGALNALGGSWIGIA